MEILKQAIRDISQNAETAKDNASRFKDSIISKLKNLQNQANWGYKSQEETDLEVNKAEIVSLIE